MDTAQTQQAQSSSWVTELDATHTGPAGTVDMISQTTLATILDELRRLKQSSDNQNQEIDSLRAELGLIKPRVEALTAENLLLKQEVEGIRVQSPSHSSVPTKEEAEDRPIELKSPSASLRGSVELVTETKPCIVATETPPPPCADVPMDGVVVQDERMESPVSFEQPIETKMPKEENDEGILVQALVPVDEVSRTDSPMKRDISATDQPSEQHRQPRKRKMTAKAMWALNQGRDSEEEEGGSSQRSAKRARKRDDARPESSRSLERMITEPSSDGLPAKLESEKRGTSTKIKEDPGVKGPGAEASSVPLPSLNEGKQARTKIPANKIKSQALTLKPTVSAQHLATTPTLTIHPAPLNFTFPISLLNKAYGAATQVFLWKQNATKAGVDPADAKKFVYPSYDVNPEMPAAPGEPGLLMTNRTDTTEGNWTLFYRVLDTSASENPKHVKWAYAGEYRSEVAGHLSASDFKLQPQKVKDTWGNKIATAKQIQCYALMRARITLRKLGKKVNEGSVEAERKVIAKWKKGSPSQLSTQDVVEALENGDENIMILRMECVSYNHAFVEELMEKQAEVVE